ncbi:dTDP-4-dehydrorhamnose 3,5-epimerase family protein [Streptomyces sp. NPDC051133]|uniref:dTDP-4-dehydrorhamnose 3,5-epimerase family protein n=1 Tax=Streptomyces sp. NPDC051133 TaxID=3155521 RepID=UPI00341540DB
MIVRKTAVAGAFQFTSSVYPDPRGSFTAPFQEAEFNRVVQEPFRVAQLNCSRSAQGVLRGLHYCKTPSPGQRKYVYCANGRALDVIVDTREGSPTFGKWDAVEVGPHSSQSVYFPAGVAHGFLALESNTLMVYMVSTPYEPEHEFAIDPLDPQLALPWPKHLSLIRSERDVTAPTLHEAAAQGLLPHFGDYSR